MNTIVHIRKKNHIKYIDHLLYAINVHIQIHKHLQIIIFHIGTQISFLIKCVYFINVFHYFILSYTVTQ